MKRVVLLFCCLLISVPLCATNVLEQNTVSRSAGSFLGLDAKKIVDRILSIGIFSPQKPLDVLYQANRPFWPSIYQRVQSWVKGHPIITTTSLLGVVAGVYGLAKYFTQASNVGNSSEGFRFRALRDISQAWKTNVKYLSSVEQQPVITGTEKFIDFVLPEEERSEEKLFLLDGLEQLLREYQRTGTISVDSLIDSADTVIQKYPGLATGDILQFWVSKASYLLLPDAFVSSILQLLSLELGKDFVKQVNAPDFQARIEKVTIFLSSHEEEWQIPFFVPSKTVVGLPGLVRLVAFSPDGSKIVTVSLDDGLVKAWDIASGNELNMFTGHTAGVTSVVFSSNSKMLAIASADGTIKIWDVTSGYELKALTGHTNALKVVSFSSDGKKLLTVDPNERIVVIWDVETGVVLRQIHVSAGRLLDVVALSPDDTKVVTAPYMGLVEIWDAVSGESLHMFSGHAGRSKKIVFSPDGSKIAAAGRDRDYRVRVWDVETGKMIYSLSGHTDYVGVVAFSPDGQKIVTASYDSTAKIWDVGTGKLLQTFVGHTSTVDSAQFSFDGKKVVTASRDETVKIWDSGTGKLLQTLYGIGGKNYEEREDVRPFFASFYVNSCAAFNSNGDLLVTRSWDGMVKVWDFNLRVRAAEKIMYDAFVASGLEQLVDEQITNPYARELIQTLNSLTAPGNELIPGIRRYEDVPAHFTKMLQHMEQNASAQTNSF